MQVKFLTVIRLQQPVNETQRKTSGWAPSEGLYGHKDQSVETAVVVVEQNLLLLVSSGYANQH